MLIKFLRLNFPISRLKFKNKFKRGIVYFGTHYFLSDKFDLNTISDLLFELLSTIFEFDTELTKSIVIDYMFCL